MVTNVGTGEFKSEILDPFALIRIHEIFQLKSFRHFGV